MLTKKTIFYYFLFIIFSLSSIPFPSFAELPYVIDFETGDSSITLGHQNCKVTYVGGYNACADYNASAYYCDRTESNIDVNATAAHSGNYGLEIEWIGGDASGSCNGVKIKGDTVIGTEYFPDPIFIRFYVKFESNFYFKCQSGNIWKLHYLETGQGDIMPGIFGYDYHTSSCDHTSAEFMVKEQGSPGPWTGDHCHGNTNGSEIHLYRNTWYCIEYGYSHTTDEYFKIWVDGTLRLVVDENTISHGLGYSFSNLPFRMIHFGGLMNNGAYQTQSVYFDDIVIDDEYIGPLGPVVDDPPGPPGPPQNLIILTTVP